MMTSCEILNALELGFALFSGKKNPTAPCLLGQFRKMKPWLSWALPLAQHWLICIFIAPAEFSELTNMNRFYHLSFSIWNCKLRTPWTPRFQQAQPNWTPNHTGSLLPLWACSNAFLLSLLSRAGLSPSSAEQLPLCLGQGERGVTVSAACPVLQQGKHKQDKVSA